MRNVTFEKVYSIYALYICYIRSCQNVLIDIPIAAMLNDLYYHTKLTFVLNAVYTKIYDAAHI